MTAPAAVNPSAPSASRVLVVDDDEKIRRLLRRILESHGFEVLTSGDGAAALAVTRVAMTEPGNPIDVVLTDIDMPGMNGYELGRRLARTWPALPVVYMSGTRHGLAGGVPLETWDHFIAKPFSASSLLPKLHFVLRPGVPQSDHSQGEAGGVPVILESELYATAIEVSRAAVAYLDDEARWALLQKWLEEEPAGQRDVGRRSLRLEALRSIVCPYVGDREWDEVVRQHWAVRWAEQLRLANALASARAAAVRPIAPKARALP
jgi:two-component system, cell cycle response regulator CpdR